MTRAREPFAGPDSGPVAPFPIRLNGSVVKGFGRGSKELGIPTANIPISGLSVGGHEDVESGVYFGWAGLNISPEGSIISRATEDASASGFSKDGSEKPEHPSNLGNVFPVVLSIGYNPFYKNTVRSVEVHIIHSFPRDFYGAHMNLMILGFIRPEYDYVSKESLIEDIKEDIEVARRSLERNPYEQSRSDGNLLNFGPGTSSDAG